MVFDEYDMTRHSGNIVYDKTMNVNRKDIIKDVIDIFSSENDIDITSISDEITRIITNIRNTYNVLDHRYITCISARVCHYIEPTVYDKQLGYKPKWYIINVFR